MLLKEYIKQIISEGSKFNNIIIVDVQKEYKNYINFNIHEMIEFTKNFNNILVLYNGQDLGMSSQQDIIDFYYEETEYDEELIDNFLNKTIFFEKNYGFFRDFMDQCFPRDDIIKLIKYMLRKKIWDIRELNEKDINLLKIADLETEKLEEYGFNIPDLAFELPKWSNSIVCGGGLEHCLEEVMLLGASLNLNFKIENRFTY